MSVQFGKCNFDGRPVERRDLDPVRAVLAPYGPDGEASVCQDNFGILYRAFHTTAESRREQQPHQLSSGATITWDGRLDNREELFGQFAPGLSRQSTDLEIVGRAYERWGINAFSKLVGDWALAIWHPKERSLILAKDFIGTRHLYYFIDHDRVIWSTVLDPLVLFAGRMFRLEREYVAGWLGFFPAPHLTPYVGIHSVPPACFVRLLRGTQRVQKYWDFDAARTIRYASDDGYEEHFREVFSEAVRRRLRSDSPILAELSGGMDSSSIVCVADDVMARYNVEGQKLDTVSYYDDSDPSWNESPYFSKVEEKRGRRGCHIGSGSHALFTQQIGVRLMPTPAFSLSSNEIENQFGACLTAGGNRVVLSGIGGDEIAGGVPTPLPELADLITTARFRHLAHQLRAWALNKRRPWHQLLWEAVKGFLPSALTGLPSYRRPVPWVHPKLIDGYREALSGYDRRLELFGPRASFQENIDSLDGLRRQLSCDELFASPPYEKRYPFLDRSFAEFMFAVPREQIVRPGQRRSLMRRALVGLVPAEVLNRKRKAHATRGPMMRVLADWADLEPMRQHMISAELGLIDARAFLEAMNKARNGQEVAIAAMVRTLCLEFWLRNLEHFGILAGK